MKLAEQQLRQIIREEVDSISYQRAMKKVLETYHILLLAGSYMRQKSKRAEDDINHLRNDMARALDGLDDIILRNYPQLPTPDNMKTKINLSRSIGTTDNQVIASLNRANTGYLEAVKGFGSASMFDVMKYLEDNFMPHWEFNVIMLDIIENISSR